jgi:hypothetical protein
VNRAKFDVTPKPQRKHSVRNYMSCKPPHRANLPELEPWNRLSGTSLLPSHKCSSAGTSINPCSCVMNAPQRLLPEQLPDPWLLDTEGLLSELARIRELALRIPPVRNDVVGPINSVVDAVWDLEQRLRFCFHLHCEAQGSFARRDHNNVSKKLTTERHPGAKLIRGSNVL